MGARKIPKPNEDDVAKAVAELYDVLDIDSLSDVDKFFALNLLEDYGRWAAIADTAWQDIVQQGLVRRETRGGKDNNHYSYQKSESIGVFKDARASKTDLAVKISRFVKNGLVVQEEEEEMDEFDRFNAQ
jgi:hypothetical protein